MQLLSYYYAFHWQMEHRGWRKSLFLAVLREHENAVTAVNFERCSRKKFRLCSRGPIWMHIRRWKVPTCGRNQPGSSRCFFRSPFSTGSWTQAPSKAPCPRHLVQGTLSKAPCPRHLVQGTLSKALHVQTFEKSTTYVLRTTYVRSLNYMGQ